MIVEVITEARVFLIVKEKDMYSKMIDFGVKLNGVQKTVKNTLLEI